ncbi:MULTISPECIES: MarR family winged helix-turn-helix transcriptional regulator [Halocynthiibacter]|uniref:MarR family transcriptional regulator n=1 Tax=Halocynthiibacter halioticoli TaxID=2986804 RepID=A0AAE3LRX5_9RHOB|nr:MULTISPECIES: helix-turn-helix domain-containing protein [Halocynthiibacter]MCV6824924.1 MarR family transcriptional regulator [Halocynthiibacter halioticoli]MCW4057925.1 MarR family transcriptional regulator [Halocynthiibacter sp. SDUM655004]
MNKRDIAAAVLLENILRSTYPSREPGAIQPLQWSILRFIARVPEEQRTANMISNYLGVTAAPLSRAIQTLVKRGYIVQKKNAKDARSFLLFLTDEAVEALKSDPLLRLADSVSQLPEDQRDAFNKALEQIVKDMQ